MYIAASNLLEFKIPRDVGRDEDVREFAVGHEELGNQIDVPVVHTAVLLPWLGACLEVAVSLEEL